MDNLDRDTLDKITHLLSPLLQDKEQREALLTQAFGTHPLLNQIDYEDSTYIFVTRLIRQLIDYGKANIKDKD